MDEIGMRDSCVSIKKEKTDEIEAENWKNSSTFIEEEKIEEMEADKGGLTHVKHEGEEFDSDGGKNNSCIFAKEENTDEMEAESMSNSEIFIAEKTKEVVVPTNGRGYKKKVGGRRYRGWTDELMARVLVEIREKKVSIREAAKKYGIHRNTLAFKLRESVAPTPPRPSGGQLVFSTEEEGAIVSHLIALASYGFPITLFELRLFIKTYLTRINRKVARFSDNMPGKEWARLFLKRHQKELPQCMSQIGRFRTALDRTSINQFFDNLQLELLGIPANNVWNYDEFNLQDDPGAKKVLIKRGAKHPEIIKNAKKASVSIMMCGNAAGSLAPVYVTYKAEDMGQCWMEGGPAGTCYNHSKSGWFDERIFEDWFEFLMLPILRKQTGTKVLIGDNLSSHINARVLSLCQEHCIKFIALPPHSTHLLQPLDIAFFHPMKVPWRSILNKWKETEEGRQMATVPKTKFPILLNDLLLKLKDQQQNNLISSFKECGIYPVNREEALGKLSDNLFQSSVDHLNNVSSAFLEVLQNKRNEMTPKVPRRKQKMDVPPGKGIPYSDLITSPFDQPQSSAIPSKESSKNFKKNKIDSSKKKKVKRPKKYESSSEENDDNLVSDTESEDSMGSLLRELGNTDNEDGATPLENSPRQKDDNHSQEGEEE
ncbi:uncharacterized protein [Halyomorpha halys]|uniref:uncharacterized protein isoform X3 n=2 Tax=Halyomorpha halys TaxID=286706 RepID=UPI0006D4F627|nr:uncharacterized protein LOC106679171 isoform X3 [Halyomorpha halys]